jgi:hypothetical protein
MKKIYFDMDGTVADLYGEKNWLDNLRKEVCGSFINLRPLVDMTELSMVCHQLMNLGYSFGVITWLPMGASYEFERVCEEEKRAWVEEFMPWVSEFYAQSYGVPKQYAPSKRAAEMILVDDNAEVRAMWNTEVQRSSIDATQDIIKELRKLLDN